MSLNDSRADLADQVETGVLATPGVTGLYGGHFGEIATYLPGRRVAGVLIDDDLTEVHIVVDAAFDLLDVAEATRVTVEKIVGGAAQVTVEDIVINTASDSAQPTKAVDHHE